MSFNRAPKGHLCTMWELKQKTEYHLVPPHLGTGDSNFSVLSISEQLWKCSKNWFWGYQDSFNKWADL